MLNFKCPQCNVALKVADDKAGQKGKCPKCQMPLVIPRMPPLQANARRPTTTEAHLELPVPSDSAPEKLSSASGDATDESVQALVDRLAAMTQEEVQKSSVGRFFGQGTGGFRRLDDIIAEELATHGREGVPCILNALEGCRKVPYTMSFNVALGMIRALGRIRDERAVEPLLDLFEIHRRWGGSSWNNSGEIAEALGHIGDRRCVGPLLRSLKELGEWGDIGGVVGVCNAMQFMKVAEAREVLERIVSVSGQESHRPYVASWIGKSAKESLEQIGPLPRSAPAPETVSATPADVDKQIDSLWDAAKTAWSRRAYRDAVSVYTRLLKLVQRSTKYNACASLRNRAMCFRMLEDYEEALADLTQELSLAKQLNDRLRVMQCRKLLEETQQLKRDAAVRATGGDKARKFEAMDQQESCLGRDGADGDAAFVSLFSDLENADADIRARASSLLGESRHALKNLVSLYRECADSDRRRASLAGRVLGRRIAKGTEGMIHAQASQLMFGLPVSFVPCPCVHCGYLNRGIAAPPGGPMVGYYSQSDDKGAYAVPVLCDKCGKEFFVVWDTVPG